MSNTKKWIVQLELIERKDEEGSVGWYDYRTVKSIVIDALTLSTSYLKIKTINIKESR